MRVDPEPFTKVDVFQDSSGHETASFDDIHCSFRVLLNVRVCSVMALLGKDDVQSLPVTAKVVSSLLCSSLIFHVLWRRYWGAERKSKSALKGNILLPTPPRLLPNWFGSLSGHTLLLEREKVIFGLVFHVVVTWPTDRRCSSLVHRSFSTSSKRASHESCSGTFGPSSEWLEPYFASIPVVGSVANATYR